METKTCSHCKIKQEVSNFVKNKSTKDGIASWCKRCNSNALISWAMRGGKEKKKVYEQDRHNADPSKRKEKALKANYGITLEDYNVMWAAQDECCAICKTQKTKGRGFHVDHDHATGKVRGILCNQCNLALGHFEDDTIRMLSAINYLKEHA